jgi:hypothetical protein
VVDLQRQIDTATAYFLAGERCRLELGFGPYGSHSVSAPTITNYALSVEISLKLLYFLAHDKEVTKRELTNRHSLQGLFNLLPCSTKTNLSYMQECLFPLKNSMHPSWVGLVAEDEEDKGIDNYFVDWRYPYEKEFLIGDFDNPRRSFIECYREIRRLDPKLMSVYEKNWGQFEPDWINAWGNNMALEIKGQNQND